MWFLYLDSQFYLVLFGAMSEGLKIRVNDNSVIYGLEAKLFDGKSTSQNLSLSFQRFTRHRFSRRGCTVLSDLPCRLSVETCVGCGGAEVAGKLTTSVES